MPVGLIDLIQRSRQGKAPAHSPGEVYAPLIGNERTAPGLVRGTVGAIAKVRSRGEKIGHVSMSAFVDEFEKISYVPNTPGDRAGIWRALLASMVGKSLDHHHSSNMMQQEMTQMGHREDAENYSQDVQALAAQNMMRDSALRAALQAQGGAAVRSVI